MTAFVTSPRSVARVDQFDARSDCLGLVSDKCFQLSERPGMQTPPLSFSGFNPFANIGEIFQNNRSAGLDGIDNTPGENVIAIAAESSLPGADLPEFPLGRLGSLALALPLLPKDASFNILPSTLAKEPGVAGDGGTIDAKIDADVLLIGANLRSGKIDNDVQPPTTILVEQVGGANLAADHRTKIVGQNKRNAHLSVDGRKPRRAGRPVHLERVDVVSRRTKLRDGTGNFPALLRQSQSRLHGFRRFDAGLNVKVTDKIGHRVFTGPVGEVSSIKMTYGNWLSRRIDKAAKAARNRDRNRKRPKIVSLRVGKKRVYWDRGSGKILAFPVTDR